MSFALSSELRRVEGGLKKNYILWHKGERVRKFYFAETYFLSDPKSSRFEQLKVRGDQIVHNFMLQ